MASAFRQYAKSRKGRFLLTGIPFVCSVIGGSYFLSTFTKSQTDMNDKRTTSKSKRKFDIDEEHKKIVAQLNIDDYQLSRVPRPEETNAGAVSGAGAGGRSRN
eukprot:CAMPEP_0114428748 /NCGR_PEP_ID=MMETSP0103-20121206/9103_1 /TAXON_ID=37642 ORGANISM="Paraphysomonas imperforata, Strain PA2" /NCGR_SAMPLE_ID=MMETSP0103 /ASSEMBLY_ACC=CAM_ASM_000201 /LENGTH=102 /DNA_ID=CAMNT_0001598009 /DNA_START=20 /DNA_END=331 /DNA_ORIENTATION=-